MHRCKSPSQAEIVLDVCSILKEQFKHSLHLMIICMILMKNREVFHHMARSLFLLTCVCSLISSRMNLKVIYMDIGFLVMSLEKCFWPKQTYEIWSRIMRNFQNKFKLTPLAGQIIDGALFPRKSAISRVWGGGMRPPVIRHRKIWISGKSCDTRLFSSILNQKDYQKFDLFP